jgi:PEP-CTERM motif
MQMIRTLGLVAVLAASPVAAATYLPVGPQLNVAVSTVTTGGWSLCYSATMATIFGSSAATALSDCTGDRLLVAGRETGSATLLVLAQALKTDVLFNTGAANNNVTNIANGTGWYNADNWSFGFVPAGETPNKNECDTAAGEGRLCIHTLTFTGGYRINDIQGLNNSADFEKLVYTSSGNVVPEPASWALLIAGFGLVGAIARRRRMLAAS